MSEKPDRQIDTKVEIYAPTTVVVNVVVGEPKQSLRGLARLFPWMFRRPDEREEPYPFEP